MSLEKASSRPLFSQLEDMLRSLIENGKLHPGDRIPSELELAGTYKISRMTVRRAIDRLVSEGVLFRQPGKGTFVAQPKMPYPPPTAVSFSSAIRSLGLSVTTRVLDLRLVPPPLRVATELRQEKEQEVIFLRRLRCIENEPMAIHISYMPSQYFSRIVNEDLVNCPLNQVMEKLSGLRIVGSHDYIEATVAQPEEAHLLGIRAGAPMLLIRGVVYAQQGVPVRSTKSLFRGDRFRFLVGAKNLLEIETPGAGRDAGNVEAQWLNLDYER